MFRRCASLLVIAGLLASQLAAVPHAHAAASAEERVQHDATPHVHCGWLGHSDHGHSHSHHGRSHDDDGLENSALVDSAETALSAYSRVDDHDADAVFLANSSCSDWTAGQSKASVVAWQFAALMPLLLIQTDVEPNTLGSPPWRPPDAVLDASKTYLTLRNLRI